MQPCVLHVDTRPSIWKLYLNLLQLTLDMSCHQHSSLMKFKKRFLRMESVNNRCCQSQEATHHLFSPLHSTPLCVFLHHIMIQSGGARRQGEMTGFVFSPLSCRTCRSLKENHRQLTKEGREQKTTRKVNLLVLQQLIQVD